MLIKLNDEEIATFYALRKEDKENNKKLNRKERRALLFGRKKKEEPPKASVVDVIDEQNQPNALLETKSSENENVSIIHGEVVTDTADTTEASDINGISENTSNIQKSKQNADVNTVAEQKTNLAKPDTLMKTKSSERENVDIIQESKQTPDVKAKSEVKTEEEKPAALDKPENKLSTYTRHIFRIGKIKRRKIAEDISPASGEFDITEDVSNYIQSEEKQPEIPAEPIDGAAELHEITLNDAVEEVLYPTVTPYIEGLRCFFIAHPGTHREEYIYKYTDLLYRLGKIGNSKPLEYSFGAIPEKIEEKTLYVISDLESAINHLFNLEDFSDEASHKQKIYHDILYRLIKAPRNSYIIFSCSKEEYSGFLLLDAKIPYMFSKRIFFSDFSDEQVYDEFIDYLPDIHKEQVTDEFKEKAIGFINRNRRFYPFFNQELSSYLAQYASNQEELMLPPEKYNPKALQETFDNIIGLDEVKRQVYELERYLNIRNKLIAKGVNPPEFNLHMMFLGNPGVGKTTIARVIAKLLFDLGYLREEKLVEVTSKDLVGGYGNQTGLKTNKAIMSAMGGVLFVDEAYSLSNNCGAAGAEAIAILIKAMMDYKNDLVVMFAGYSLEMRSFIESNSGIASRISYMFKFEDYTKEQLYDIFMLKLKKIGMDIAPEAEEEVRTRCKEFARRKNAGNGRFVDNLIQKCLTKHASLDLPDDKLLILQEKSIPRLDEMMTTIN